jgi:predicted Zn-dependent peptidase
MHYTIENIAGIDCIFAPMQDTNAITLQIICKAGSIYESSTLNGVSHFLEHNFFKGGKNTKPPKKSQKRLTVLVGSLMQGQAMQR